jgi:Uma2 family endonuclease
MMNASEQPPTVQEAEPLYFPEEAEMPETKWHLELRTALYQILKLAVGDRATIGCDQFVYWDPTDPKACLAPDSFVRLGQKDEMFGSWKVWERGAPHVAVEFVSEHDTKGETWDVKLAKYRRLGVLELVRFDAEELPQLTVWDHVGGNLVKRELADPRRAECRPLGLSWVVVDDADCGTALRLADPVTNALLPTPAEKAEAATERVRALEEELRRLGASKAR